MDSEITSGNFTFKKTSIEGVIIVEPRCYGDSRGYFMETYKRPDFVAGGITADFIQDNQSSSTKGVLRGLHFQIRYPQAKLVRVVSGEVLDVCVDLRPESPTLGQVESALLTAENKKQLFIPRGFAHGFYVLSESAVFCYKCDDVYHPNDEGGIRWDDPDLGIDWAIPESSSPVLSPKDKCHPSFAQWREEAGL